MILIMTGIVAGTLLPASLAGLGVRTPILLWSEVILGILAGALLVVVVPLVRRRLLSPERVRSAEPETFKSWGLPEDIPPAIARPAIFLTRYTAGCVVTWGLAAAVGLYGLVARLLGAPSVLAGALLAAGVFVLLLLPPRKAWVRQQVESLAMGR
jgi:hypothetical protein